MSGLRWIGKRIFGRTPKPPPQSFASAMRSAMEEDNGLILGLEGFEKWIGDPERTQGQTERFAGSLRRRSWKIFGSRVRRGRTHEE